MFGQKPNTIKNLLIEKPKTCLENDNTLQLSPEDFPKDDDSTIIMRNKTRNTKLEGQFAKTKGQIVTESEHTITMDTPRGRQVISKRDVAKLKKPKSASHSPQTKQQQGNSHSSGRKIAALKEAARKQNKRETKQEQESTKKIDYKRKDIPKPIRSPRKQKNPKSPPGHPPPPPKQNPKK